MTMDEAAAPEIRSPDCPMCGYPPIMATMRVMPWFCSNDGCETLSWDPRQTPGQIRAETAAGKFPWINLETGEKRFPQPGQGNPFQGEE